MPSAFISYRREDTAGHAGRLHDRLVTLFGPDSVFIDVSDIQPGADYRKAIEETIAKCDALLAVIGPTWLAHLQARAGREDDLVAAEILAALVRKITIIPVLVGGAAMPLANDLPERLRPLHRCNAVQIHDTRFDDGFQQLAGSLRTLAGLAPFDLSGQWIAEMARTDSYALREKLPPSRYHLDFYVVQGLITGSVTYPTGAGVIEEGTVTGRRIIFRTSHLPQFEQDRAITRFMGEVVNDELHLTCVGEGGIIDRGIARRARTIREMTIVEQNVNCSANDPDRNRG
jgi:hypothetical protein